MITIIDFSEKHFKLDGVEFPKIYQPLAQGSQAIGIYSIYDTRKQLINSTNYTEFTIDGTVYTSQAETIAALLDVVWYGLSQAEIDAIEVRVDNLEENQYSGVVVYSTLAELPVTGTLLVSYKVSNDATSTNNGFYHWTGAAYVKDADLMLDNAILANDLDANSNKVVNLAEATDDDDAISRGFTEESFGIYKVSTSDLQGS